MIKMYAEKLDREVDITVYLPDTYDEEKRYPVVYMHDGQNLMDPELTAYGHVWQLKDALRYQIRDAIYVGIASPNSNKRTDEYCPYQNELSKGLGKEYLDFVCEVVDYVDSNFNTLPEPKERLLMGSSLGGVITTYAAAHYRDTFYNFACVSNAYWIDDRIFDDIKKIKDCKLYLDVGTNEGREEYTPLNDKAYELLKHLDPLYIRIPGALHNEEEWAVRLPLILRWFLGGKE